MEFLYILFAFVLVLAECSSYINTHNIIKKLGIFFISIGCLIQYAGHSNMMIFIGAFMYISVDFWLKYKIHQADKQYQEEELDEIHQG